MVTNVEIHGDPLQFSHLVNVMASKQLADYEIRRGDKDKKEQQEK
jgi:hypothetical protein